MGRSIILQKVAAHAAIDSGADLVLGAHPHVVQSVEVYEGKPIFYSLANFVFDQVYWERTRLGLAVKLTIIEKGLAGWELIPTRIGWLWEPEILMPFSSSAEFGGLSQRVRIALVLYI